MPDVILHHYPASPFAEKARLMLGAKGLAWGSVVVPVVMPKPDLTALTGGYRKTPVLQLGCDVYCDTFRIAALLDEIQPDPPLLAREQAAVAVAAGRWFDQTLFFACILLLFRPEAAAGALARMPADEASRFAKDRADLMRGARLALPSPEEAAAIVAGTLARLEAQLAAGPSFLLGGALGWADLCAYHPLWAVRSNPALAPRLDPCPAVRAWMDRVDALGHGRPEETTSEAALARARDASPRPLAPDEGPPLDGLARGDAVEVAASDYGTDPVRGVLARVGTDEVVVRRRDERAGEVVVHFPRVGFAVRRAG